MTRLILLMLWAVAMAFAPAPASIAQPMERNVVVIAHANVRKLDATLLKRVFTGKTIEIDGVRVVPVNLATGAARHRFLADFLDTTEDEYVGYWTVRRYVGKGTPPLEVRQAADMIDYVNRTPGAIGYVDEADLPRGMNVVLRK